MNITRDQVAQKLAAYLNHSLSLSDLVAWAESAMMAGEFEEGDFEKLRDVVGRLGVADVRAFGLTWEDCDRFLAELGYSARVQITAN